MATRKNHRWTIKDVEYLRIMAPIASARMIAAEMGMKETAIDGALKRFGIKMRPKKI